MYPLGKTTREIVTARWGHQAEIMQRPRTGWKDYLRRNVVARCLESERRTGRRVDSCEIRFGADGMFSLCYCWFYYNRHEELVDADWQWSSDQFQTHGFSLIAS